MRFGLDGTFRERFVSVVACEREIPAIVQRLTGITREELAGAPPADAVLSELAAFVGDAWIVGHNVAFDLGFLEAHGFPSVATRLDTAELASIVFPTAPSYALQRLASVLRGETRAHRALEDAEAAALVLLAVFREASSLAVRTLEGLIQLAEPLGGSIGWFLGQALAERARAAFDDGAAVVDGAPSAPGPAAAAHFDATIPDLFAPTGPLAAAFDAYEARPEQIELAAAIDAVMAEGGALVAEAGTGTGKSLAYLVPALLAAARGRRVLVSTHTTTLQDQLAASDVPRVVAALGQRADVAVLKGRANYLCPRRWHLFRLAAFDPDEVRFAMKTLVWRDRTRTGDRAELNLLGGGEQLAWSRVCAEDETCTARRCALVRGGCYLERARTAAARASLVVANHALVLSDARARNRLLPDVDIVVADEAHHLDEVAAHVFGVRVTAAEIRRAVQRVGQATAAVAPDVDATAVREATQDALVAVEETFVALARLMRDPSERGYEDQRRITPALRGSDEWLAAEVAAERLRDALATVDRAATSVLGGARDPDRADAAAELESALAEVRGLDAAVGRVVHLPPRGEICWLALDQGGALALQSAPAHAGAQIDRALARERHAAVFTSATLAVAGSFGFVLDRFGLGDRAATLRVGSGFDYRRQALLVLPSDLADPYDRWFVDQAAEVVADIARRLEGRTLALFTSHAMLRAVHARLAEWSERERIVVLAQSAGGSRRQLLEQFVTGRAVLLGTSTFWEGIDLPGDLLRCVVIAKLPFPVPDDPLVAGRSERYEDPFREYHVPVAALRLRQGFGRLIRTREDRGAVVLLDRRLSSRTYGETFLRSLPDCEIARPDRAGVAGVVGEWCDQKNDRRLE